MSRIDALYSIDHTSSKDFKCEAKYDWRKWRKQLPKHQVLLHFEFRYQWKQGINSLGEIRTSWVHVHKGVQEWFPPPTFPRRQGQGKFMAWQSLCAAYRTSCTEWVMSWGQKTAFPAGRKKRWQDSAFFQKASPPYCLPPWYSQTLPLLWNILLLAWQQSATLELILLNLNYVLLIMPGLQLHKILDATMQSLNADAMLWPWIQAQNNNFQFHRINRTYCFLFIRFSRLV